MKFIIVESVNGDVTGYVTAPYYAISKDKSKAKLFEYGLDASLTAFALRKQNHRDYLVQGVKEDE